MMSLPGCRRVQENKDWNCVKGSPLPSTSFCLLQESPRKQGLKFWSSWSSIYSNMSLGCRRVQENKDWNKINSLFPPVIRCVAGESKKTRIEIGFAPLVTFMYLLLQESPRKQGLKLPVRISSPNGCTNVAGESKKTRIEIPGGLLLRPSTTAELQESPRKQGLKLSLECLY